MPKNQNGQNRNEDEILQEHNVPEEQLNINQMGEFKDPEGIEDEIAEEEQVNEEPVNENREEPVNEEPVNENREEPVNEAPVNENREPANEAPVNNNRNQENKEQEELEEEPEAVNNKNNPAPANKDEQPDPDEERRRKEKEKKVQEAAVLLAKKLEKHVGMKDMSNESFEKHKGIAAAALAGINLVDPGFVSSSDAFKYFKGSLEEVDRQAKKLSSPPTAGELRRYSNAHRILAEDCDNYLDYKHNEKKLSKLGKKRVAFVEEKKKFAETNRDFWHQQYLESLKINDLSRSQLNKNSENIQDLYKDLKDVDPFYVKSSKEFKQVKKSLEDLKKLADEMGSTPTKEQMRKYILATKRLERACDKYETYKGDGDSSRAVKRLDFVRDAKEFAIKNQQDFTDIAKEMGYEYEFSEEELKFDYEREQELEQTVEEKENKNPEADGTQKEIEEALENAPENAPEAGGINNPEVNNAEEPQLNNEQGPRRENRDEPQPVNENRVVAGNRKEAQPENERVVVDVVINDPQPGFMADAEVIDVLKGEDFWDKEYGDTAKIKGLDNASMKENAKMIGELVDGIEGVDPKLMLSSEEFRRMKAAALDVKKLAEDMAEEGEPTNSQINRYIRKNNELRERVSDYIGADKTQQNLAKQNANTAKRVEYAERLREFSRINSGSLGELKEQRDQEFYEEATKEIEDAAADIQAVDDVKAGIEYSRRMDLGTEEYRNVYASDEEVFFLENPKGYDIDGNAIQGLTQLYLMASDEEGKYSLEDLADPTKFVEEKKAAAKEVMEHIAGGSREDQMWIGAVIYKGQTNGMKLIDDYTKNLDVTHPDFIHSEQCANVGNICQSINAGTKALSCCKEEFTQVAKEISGKDVKFDRYKQDVKDRNLFINNLTASARRLHKGLNNLEKNPDNERARRDIIESSYKLNVTRKMIKDGLSSRENASVTKLFEDKKTLRAARNVFNEITADENAADLTKNLAADKELFEANKGKLMSGKFFGEVDFREKDGVMKAQNLPNVEGLKRDRQYAYIADSKLDRAVAKADRENKELMDSTDNPNQKEFLTKAKDSREKLLALSKKDGDLTPAEIHEANQCMKNIVAENFLKFAKENAIMLPDNTDDFTSRVEELPEYQKSSQFVSKGSIREFLAEDKGNSIIKNTIMMEKEKADKIRDDELADNMNPEVGAKDKAKEKDKNKKNEQPELGGLGI